MLWVGAVGAALLLLRKRDPAGSRLPPPTLPPRAYDPTACPPTVQIPPHLAPPKRPAKRPTASPPTQPELPPGQAQALERLHAQRDRLRKLGTQQARDLATGEQLDLGAILKRLAKQEGATAQSLRGGGKAVRRKGAGALLSAKNAAKGS